MEESNAVSYITNLPNELITLILLNNDPKDIMNFGLTCKKSNEIVNNNEYLWRVKYSEIVPRRYMKNLFDGTVLQEVKNVYKIKRKIELELQTMSPKHYAQVNQVSVEHLRNFYAIATESNQSFYYTVFLLQEFVDKSRKILQNFECVNPINNLTGIYYAKIVLSHLIHMFLAIKWVRELKRENLTPEVVLMFFLQWIDCDHLYSDVEVYYQIRVLVEEVKSILDRACPSGRGDNYKELNEREVLKAITQVIYKHENFSIAKSVKIYNLNIVKVIQEGEGEAVVYFTIYQAVARYFGIECKLISYPDHLFLTWCDKLNSNKEYSIDINTGELRPKGKCPYSQTMKSVFGQDPLIHFLLNLYITSKGSYRDSGAQNAIHVLDFLSYRRMYRTRNPYENFFNYLMDNIDEHEIGSPLDMAYLSDSQLNMIRTLGNLNAGVENMIRNVQPKIHPPTVLYAVGMLCYHEVYNYMCIILGWEEDCSKAVPPIQGAQPCYRVIAGDQSVRYVAQGNLKLITTPFRIPSLEEDISTDFTHFDGYSYALNEMKKYEYPDEAEIVESYKGMLVKANVGDAYG